MAGPLATLATPQAFPPQGEALDLAIISQDPKVGGP